MSQHGRVGKPGIADAQVQFVDSCLLTVTQEDWPFALAHAAEIDAFWQTRQAANPSLFNGRIYMLSRFTLAEGEFSGVLRPVEFKAFYYWKEHGAPDVSTFDVFGSALIRSDDGAVILGRQRAGNLNAGFVYLPGGFIDGRDVQEGCVDIRGSVLREVSEETGLSPHGLAVRDGFLVTMIGQQISIAIELVGDGNAEMLLNRIRMSLAAEAHSELDEIVAVREWRDVEALPVPAYAQALLSHVFRPRMRAAG